MPTPEQIRDSLQTVNNQQTFIQNLLINTLGWQIPQGIEQIEDISYGWNLNELNAANLNRQIVDGHIYQIQPIRADQPWGIFLLEFTNHDAFLSGRGLKGALRKILRALVPKRRAQGQRPVWNRECLLFICTHNYEHYTFAYFKKPTAPGLSEPLATFGWGHDVPSRTAYENLIHLEWPDEETLPARWVQKWADAFDIEKVTNKFYEDYENIFEYLKAQVAGLTDDEDKKLFVQTLMNRLLFLRFVEKKGWLRLETEDRPQNYLQKLFHAGPIGRQSWYNSRLKVLFFEGMAIPQHNREQIVGQVPYLNGGLFEKKELDDRARDIPDEAFIPILGEEGLFYKYNFTVEESTPLDIDVAVDPEMLGKVFEKLVNDRNKSGSYYTPRPVVSFMCREALKGYFGSDYATLIDERNASSISVPQARQLLEKLDKVKVVDPACGSGAYLLGMLHELFELTSLLDTRARTQTPKDDYHRKLSIIQNNLYGVDLDDFAINIARLRLWLSLAVEFDGEIPEPLPNLDFKIESGDSLTAPDPSGGIEPGLHRELSKRYIILHQQYLNPPPEVDKKLLLRRIVELKADIVEWLHSAGPVEGFDWQAEFLEVFIDGGFDIVLANPPYGASVEDHVRDLYFNRRNPNEKGQSKDTYGLFISRGLQLLKPNGILSYIVSDTWRTIKTHRPLRSRLLERTTIFHVLDLPPWIFEARVDTGIITLRKAQATQDHKIIAGDLRSIEKDNWKSLSDNLIAISGQGADIQTETYARYTYPQRHITSYDNLSFFIGSPKLYLLMSNPGFTRFGTIADVKQGLATADNEYYLRKREGARGSYEFLEENLLLTDEQITNLTDVEKQNGVNPHNYEGRHFVPYDKGGASDAEEGWLPNYHVPTEYFIDWSTQSVHRLRTATIADVKRRKGEEDRIRPSDEDTIAAVIRNPQYYFQDGITFSPTGFYSPSFRLGCKAIFGHKGSTIFLRNGNPKAYLGLLCSSLTKYLLKVYRSHTVETGEEVVCQLNIPPLAQGEIEELSRLVNSIIEQQRHNAQYQYYLHEQKVIDTLVIQLYGLLEEDVREIELWYCRRYPPLAEAQGLLAEVKGKYAAHLERCKRILEKPPVYWRSNPILQLIAQGESHTLEFKETLEYDVRENQQNRNLNKACLKTIAAFLNTNGGTLLIGVSDSGEVKGISRDMQFVRGNNTDGFEQKLRSLLNDRFDPSPLGSVTIVFEELQGGTVCKVGVQLSKEVVHLDNEVYIRDGNGTRQLEGRTLTDWIQQRTGR